DITPTKLLLLVENAGSSGSTDTSQNGLWIINTDGTGLTRLTTDTDNSQALCPFSQYYWSNVTHDGSMYALQGFNPNTNEYKLLFGSTSGGNPTQFADINDGTTLQLAGWTTM
ncbi:MAG: serine/threonine protein kinase, partial [Ktedonobacteraceae bacterium]